MVVVWTYLCLGGEQVQGLVVVGQVGPALEGRPSRVQLGGQLGEGRRPRMMTGKQRWWDERTESGGKRAGWAEGGMGWTWSAG